jgi:NAD(P)-dependent dehydrogenase (short-subunit alcohol dehydrogenase family)
MDLRGKNILVTGAARRLGRAIAIELASSGTSILVHHHASPADAEATCESIRRLGVAAHTVQADVRSTSEIQTLFEEIDRFGPLHGLVNSAAVMLAGDLLTVSEDEWHSTIDVNLKGAFFVLQHAALRIRRAGGGAVVNIADIAGLRPWPRFPIHSISKAGVLALTQVAALALAPDIRVNAVIPGPVLKPDQMPATRWEALGKQLPIGHVGTPGDVAQAVRFLMENDFITGEALLVDGGNQFVTP